MEESEEMGKYNFLQVGIEMLSRDQALIESIQSGNLESCIQTVMKLMSEYKIVPKLCLRGKNSKVAMDLRLEGNRVFDLLDQNSPEHFVIPHNNYTKCIAIAPGSSQELALAFGNRSATLYCMRKYTESVKDIEMALKLNTYPQKFVAELYLRKVECFVAIGSSRLKRAYAECKHYIDQAMKGKEKKKYNERLKKYDKYLFTTVDKVSDEISPRDLMRDAFELDSTCEYMAIEYNEICGRYLVATKNINPGEIVSIRKPYVMVMALENLFCACSECLEESWANIPCDYCNYAMYCSEKCKSEAWKKYHDIECAIMANLVEIGDTEPKYLAAIRLAIIASREAGDFQKLKETVESVDNCTDPSKKGFSEDGIFHDDKYVSAYSLINHMDKISVNNFISRAMRVSLYAFYMATLSTFFGIELSTNWTEIASDSEIIFMACLMFRHFQLSDYYFDDLGDKWHKPVLKGLIMQPVLCLQNHSCIPNSCQLIIKEGVMLCATLPIKSGEQISVMYSDVHYCTMPKYSRQETLRNYYHFKCMCEACENYWPVYNYQTSLNMMAPSIEKDIFVKYYTSLLTELYDVTVADNIPQVLKKMSEIINYFTNKILGVPLIELQMNVNTLTIFYRQICNRITISS